MIFYNTQDQQKLGCGDTDGTYRAIGWSRTKQYFTCKDKNGLFLTVDKMKQRSTNTRNDSAKTEIQNSQRGLERKKEGVDRELEKEEKTRYYSQRSLEKKKEGVDREQEKEVKDEVKEKEERSKTIQLQEEMRWKEDRIKILESEVDHLKNEVKKRLEREVSQLQQEMRWKEERNERLGREVGQLQDELRRKEATLGREVGQLQDELSRKEATISSLQAEAKENEDTVTRLRSEVMDIFTRQHQEAKVREEAITLLHEELRNKEHNIAGLHGEVRGMENANSSMQEELRQLESTNARLREEATQLREEGDRCRQQLEEEQGRLRFMETELSRRLEEVSRQAVELLEVPREEVQVDLKASPLGIGGWGSVYRGTFFGKAVAIKCLHRAILSPENEGRVRREISIMSQVRHPNLLLLIGVVLTVEGEGPLIITELLDTSLRSAYERGVLEERSKVPVLRDVASALVYLHSQRTPILHRDVSSANVLLEAIRQQHRQWKAKLSDLGSANFSHLASTPAEGAAVYAAPEVSTEDRRRQTAKIDVYSFGVLVCEVCLCRFPGGRGRLPSMLGEVRCKAPHLFSLSCDCTSHTHRDRPTMRMVLERIDQV